jgi:hypothetical protein
VGGPEEALQRVFSPGFDPRAEVVVEPAQSSPRWPGPAEQVGEWTVHVPGPGWAVLSVPWVPGLQVWDGPRRLEVHPADAAFLAVELPAGAHHLTVRYQPPEVALGLAVSCLGLAILSACWAWPRRRR